MELLLWRWSTAVQVTSAVLIAGFFLTLAFSVRRVEVRPWILAWSSNVVAMLATVAFWYLQPESEPVIVFIRFAYLSAKTWFVVLLLIGIVAFGRRGWNPRDAITRSLVPVVVGSAIAAFLVPSVDVVGVLQAGTVAVLMGAGAAHLIRTPIPGALGLILGLGSRAVLGAVEAAAYLVQARSAVPPEGGFVPVFLATHSAFDTGAEWVIVLGCVLVLYRTVQAELMDSIDELRETQQTLQGLVDRDPLTGLSNRRAAPAVMRRAFNTGATVLYFDLDGFKRINDTLGHSTGDRCLRVFALALTRAFRPGDKVMRFGGDEFVVVAPDALPEQVLPRVDDLLRDLQSQESDLGVSVHFSLGHAYMPPGGDPDDALAAADQDMYREKELRQQGMAQADTAAAS